MSGYVPPLTAFWFVGRAAKNGDMCYVWKEIMLLEYRRTHSFSDFARHGNARTLLLPLQ